MAEKLNCIYPYPITVLAHDIVDEAIPEWQPAPATYTAGQQVTRLNQIYTALGDVPADMDPAGVGILYWKNEGAVNSWRWRDGYLDTATEQAEQIEIELDISGTDSISLFGIDAESIRLEIADIGAGETYETGTVRIESLVSRLTPPTNYTEFVFTPWVYRAYQGYDYTPGANVHARITLLSPGGTCRLAAFVVGRKINIGGTLRGIQIGMNSYSVKELNYIKKDATLRVIDAEFVTDSGALTDAAVVSMERMEAVPTAWRIFSGNQVTNIFGYLDTGGMTISGGTREAGSIKLIGLKESYA